MMDFDGWRCRCGCWVDRERPCPHCYPNAARCSYCSTWCDPTDPDGAGHEHEGRPCCGLSGCCSQPIPCPLCGERPVEAGNLVCGPCFERGLAEIEEEEDTDPPEGFWEAVRADNPQR